MGMVMMKLKTSSINVLKACLSGSVKAWQQFKGKGSDTLYHITLLPQKTAQAGSGPHAQGRPHRQGPRVHAYMQHPYTVRILRS